jgi:DNA-binding NarL/FixJ family response regulator
VINSFRDRSKVRENSLHLSVREEQILMLIAKGFSNKIIADQLQLSVDTVCHHLKHVFEKMHVTSRTEAAIRYLNLNNPTP